MKKVGFLSFIYLVLFVNKALGCSCKYLGEIQSKRDLERYDFVALVKTEKVIDSSFRAHLANVTVLELFKGSYAKKKVSFFGRGTDCEMGPMEGDIWIVFGYYDGYFITTNSCTYSTRYAESEDWASNELLYTLRGLYNPLPNKQQLSSFWNMTYHISESFYKSLKAFFYQILIFLKNLVFH